MEHRYTGRIPLPINVLIYRQGLPVQMGRTRDLSSEGAFLETGLWQGRQPDCLELEFLPAQEGIERFRLKALVVHHNHAGVGIEFAVVDSRAERRLKDCLRHLVPPLARLPRPVAVGHH